MKNQNDTATITGSGTEPASKSKRLRVGIIGWGAIGQRRHIPESAANPNVEIVALCDINLERAQTIAAKYGNPPAYADYKQMLKQESPDIVVVGVPNALHAPMSIAALQAGCHVLVEKPMATSIADATAMIVAATKNQRFLMVGQNQRLMAAHVKARKILASNGLGAPISFQTAFKHPGPEGWSVDGAQSWFFKRELAGMGVCGDLGVHKIDLIMFLLDQKITEVSGFIETLNKQMPDSDKPIEVDDTAYLSVKTDRGVIGAINISWTNYGHLEDNGTIIYCEQGVLEIAGNPEFPIIVHHRDRSKEFHKMGAVATNEKQVGSNVMNVMVQSVLDNKPPTIDGREGLKSLRVILAAFDAAREKKIVKIEESNL